jgi:predicted Zn-ribbon and HTH transcriptional regulator
MRKELLMKETSTCEQTRNVMLAVANWLCGTIEGIAEDDNDIKLADALDSWIHSQYYKNQTLYIGPKQCETCGKAWGNLLLTEMNNLQCPDCGTVLNFTMKKNEQKHPVEISNIEALDKIKTEIASVISRISDCMQEISDRNEV